MNLKEFEEYLVIDKHSLDKELTYQPSLLYKISEACADATAARDAAKEFSALVDAKLDAHIRMTAETDDLKITEAQVKSKIQTNVEHEDAFKAYLKAKEAADKLTALKESFQTRGYMLRDLVQLHMANYFEATSSGNSLDQANYHKARERLAAARAKR